MAKAKLHRQAHYYNDIIAKLEHIGAATRVHNAVIVSAPRGQKFEYSTGELTNGSGNQWKAIVTIEVDELVKEDTGA